MTLRNVTAEGCSSSFANAFVWRGTVSIADSLFRGNTGAPMFVLQGGVDSPFCAGQQTCSGMSADIHNCTFVDNVADVGDGGALMVLPDSTVSVRRSAFRGNRAPQGSGGAVTFDSGDRVLEVVDSSFSENSAAKCATHAISALHPPPCLSGHLATICICH